MTLEWLNIDTGYLSDDFNSIYNDISNDFEKLEEIYCKEYDYEAESLFDYEFENAKKLIRNIILKINDVVNIVNNTINEYYIILNAQIELMDIDEYHDLRKLMKEAEKRTREDLVEYNIEEKIESLINLEKVINNDMYGSGICNKILDIGKIKLDEISLIEPERFILPAEYIV